MPQRRKTGKSKSRSGKMNGNRNRGPGRLRIVAGIWRSRVLAVADVEGLRPTPERVRETLFNWLGPAIAGRRCLDLFAGTGALGLEALSRGAGACVFIERSTRAADQLEKNIAKLEAHGAGLVRGDAGSYLKSYAGAPFDVVFLDPPFSSDGISELCRLLARHEVVAADARIYYEQGRDRPEPELPTGWRQLKSKAAGNVRYGLLAAPDNNNNKG